MCRGEAFARRCTPCPFVGTGDHSQYQSVQIFVNKTSSQAPMTCQLSRDPNPFTTVCIRLLIQAACPSQVIELNTLFNCEQSVHREENGTQMDPIHTCEIPRYLKEYSKPSQVDDLDLQIITGGRFSNL